MTALLRSPIVIALIGLLVVSAVAGMSGWRIKQLKAEVAEARAEASAAIQRAALEAENRETERRQAETDLAALRASCASERAIAARSGRTVEIITRDLRPTPANPRPGPRVVAADELRALAGEADPDR